MFAIPGKQSRHHHPQSRPNQITKLMTSARPFAGLAHRHQKGAAPAWNYTMEL